MCFDGYYVALNYVKCYLQVVVFIAIGMYPVRPQVQIAFSSDKGLGFI